MKRLPFVLALVMFFLPSFPAAAMDIVMGKWQGHEVLLASGPIRPGDAERLRTALKIANPLAHGARVLLLDSPGGSVSEALELSQIIRTVGVHTVIPKGAMCGSACASIVFISGKYRTVESGGLFGQHSCARNGIKDSVCNELIAQHAVRNGVSHGSVAAFVTTVEPEDMLWWEREDVDCWGVSRYPFSEESGFDRSEPCALEYYFGEMPDAHSGWRVDFMEEGFRAFLRPDYDHKRDGEMSLFCSPNHPDRLLISMDIKGPRSAIASAITAAGVILDGTAMEHIPYTVSQENQGYSRVAVSIPSDEILKVLQSVGRIGLFFSVREPFDDVWAQAKFSKSGKAIEFVVEQCGNQ